MFPTRCTERLCTVLTHWSTWWTARYTQAWRLKRLVKQPAWKCLVDLCTSNTWSMVKSKVHSAWRLKRLVKQPCWKCFPLVVLDRLCTVLTHEAHWWRARYTQAWCLKSLVKQAMLKMFPTRCTESTLHSVNTRSTLVNNKVHQAWCLKRLVMQPCWRCFPLVVLDRLYTVLTLGAHWWTTRYTKLDAWKAWSSNQLENVSYSLYWIDLAQC